FRRTITLVTERRQHTPTGFDQTIRKLPIEHERARFDLLRAKLQRILGRSAERADAAEVRAAEFGTRRRVHTHARFVVAIRKRIRSAEPTDGARSNLMQQFAAQIDEA